MADHTFTAAPNSLEIVTTYVFDAPRDRVYEAYNDPALIPKWWGPEGEPLKVEKMEVRPGGSWKFINGEGEETFEFRGVYHEAKAPERVVATWQYEGAPTVILQTVTFEELPGGKTKVIDQMVFQSLADREAMLSTGMGEGSVPMLDRLAKLL